MLEVKEDISKLGLCATEDGLASVKRDFDLVLISYIALVKRNLHM